MKFPYLFKGCEPLSNNIVKRYFEYLGYSKGNDCLGKGIWGQFSQVYTNVLQAIEENDENYLKSIMEEKLYKATQKSMMQFNDAGLKFKYIQNPYTSIGDPVRFTDFNRQQQLLQELKTYETGVTEQQFAYEEEDMKINIDCKGLFGLRINRAENQGKIFFRLPKITSIQRYYYIDIKDIMGVYNNQILVANVVFRTTRKLIAVDNQTGELAYGIDDFNNYTEHKWRFETYIPNIEWVLTDIDDYLKGNHYQ